MQTNKMTQQEKYKMLIDTEISEQKNIIADLYNVIRTEKAKLNGLKTLKLENDKKMGLKTEPRITIRIKNEKIKNLKNVDCSKSKIIRQWNMKSQEEKLNSPLPNEEESEDSDGDYNYYPNITKSDLDQELFDYMKQDIKWYTEQLDQELDDYMNVNPLEQSF